MYNETLNENVSNFENACLPWCIVTWLSHAKACASLIKSSNNMVTLFRKTLRSIHHNARNENALICLRHCEAVARVKYMKAKMTFIASSILFSTAGYSQNSSSRVNERKLRGWGEADARASTWHVRRAWGHWRRISMKARQYSKVYRSMWQIISSNFHRENTIVCPESNQPMLILT